MGGLNDLVMAKYNFTLENGGGQKLEPNQKQNSIHVLRPEY